MNKTVNFLFGTAGTAGTMEAIEVFSAAPEGLNSLIILVVKAVLSILGGFLSTKILELMRKKGKDVVSSTLKKLNVKLKKNQ
jgi:hypothetical protein